MCVRCTDSRVATGNPPTDATESWPRQACPGLPSYDCAPTALSPYRQREPIVCAVSGRGNSSSSCCSAPATTISAVSSSVFTAAWDYHT
ncbi:hypothetical protein MTO96_045013 [Rhipicephalus appendiculatus]